MGQNHVVPQLSNINLEGNLIINENKTHVIHSTGEATVNENDDDDFVHIDINDTTVNEVNVRRMYKKKMTNANERYDNRTLESPDIAIKVDLKNYDEFKYVEQETVRTDETVTNETFFNESPDNTYELDLNYN